jgi:hypothetical protein
MGRAFVRWLGPAACALPAWAALLSAPRLPFTDLPEHVATARVLRDLIAADPTAASTYAANVVGSQYWLYHLVTALLAFVVGPAHANVVVLMIVAVAYPLSLAMLLTAHGRDRRLCLFGAMPFLSRSLTIGFLPFVAAVPLVLVGLASLERNLRDPSTKREVGLAAVSVVLFYLHVDAFAVFVLSASVTVAIATFDRANLLGSCKLAARRLVFLIPAAVVLAHWILRGSLAAKTETLGFPFIGHMSFLRRVVAVPLWMGDLWTDRLDDGTCALWWGALLVLILFGLAELGATPARRVAACYAPLASALILFLVLPFRVGVAGMLNVRIATFIALFAVVIVPSPRGRFGRVVLGVAGLATVIHAGVAFTNIRRLARGSGEDSFALVERLPSKSRLLELTFDADRDGAIYPPWLHVGAWHVVSGGAVAGPSFAELPHWSVRYRDRAAPPERPLFWHPCSFRNDVEGRYYDAVLVVGPLDPFARHPPGPVFRRAERRGKFTLYLRDEGTWPGDPATDPGPCAPVP